MGYKLGIVGGFFNVMACSFALSSLSTIGTAGTMNTPSSLIPGLGNKTDATDMVNGMGFAYKHMGSVGGSIFAAVALFLMACSVSQMLDVAEKTGYHTLIKMSTLLGGKNKDRRMGLIVGFIQLLECFLAIVSLVGVAESYLKDLYTYYELDQTWAAENQANSDVLKVDNHLPIFLFLLVCVVPWLLTKNLQRLSLPSFVSFLTVLLIIVGGVYSVYKNWTEITIMSSKDHSYWPTNAENVYMTLPLVVFNFFNYGAFLPLLRTFTYGHQLSLSTPFQKELRLREAKLKLRLQNEALRIADPDAYLHSNEVDRGIEQKTDSTDSTTAAAFRAIDFDLSVDGDLTDGAQDIERESVFSRDQKSPEGYNSHRLRDFSTMYIIDNSVGQNFGTNVDTNIATANIASANIGPRIGSEIDLGIDAEECQYLGPFQQPQLLIHNDFEEKVSSECREQPNNSRKAHRNGNGLSPLRNPIYNEKKEMKERKEIKGELFPSSSLALSRQPHLPNPEIGPLAGLDDETAFNASHIILKLAVIVGLVFYIAAGIIGYARSFSRYGTVMNGIFGFMPEAPYTWTLQGLSVLTALPFLLHLCRLTLNELIHSYFSTSATKQAGEATKKSILCQNIALLVIAFATLCLGRFLENYVDVSNKKSFGFLSVLTFSGFALRTLIVYLFVPLFNLAVEPRWSKGFFVSIFIIFAGLVFGTLATLTFFWTGQYNLD